MQKVIFRDLGLIDYKEAWNYQENLFNEIISLKIKNRDSAISQTTPNYLLFCEHPHVYTLGKSGDMNNLLINDDELVKNKASFYKINRGGDITYHGPGQLVGYPVFDLDNFFTDIHKYIRFLEEAVIRTLAEYKIEGARINGKTGVWLDINNPSKARKICAIGVRCSRWVTMHGFAFNINNDLSFFNNIIPCGIQGSGVTSMEKEIGSPQPIKEIQTSLLNHLSQLFEFNLLENGSLTE